MSDLPSFLAPPAPPQIPMSLEAQLATAMDTLHQREALIVLLQRTIQDRDDIIAQHLQTIAERDAGIQSQDVAIHVRDSSLIERATEIEDLASQILVLRSVTASLLGRLETLSAPRLPLEASAFDFTLPASPAETTLREATKAETSPVDGHTEPLPILPAASLTPSDRPTTLTKPKRKGHKPVIWRPWRARSAFSQVTFRDAHIKGRTTIFLLAPHAHLTFINSYSVEDAIKVNNIVCSCGGAHAGLRRRLAGLRARKAAKAAGAAVLNGHSPDRDGRSMSLPA